MQLPNTSLAFSLHVAGSAIAEVIDGHNLNEVLTRCWQAHPDMPPATRGAVQDLAYSALRQFGRGDFILGRLMQTAVRDLHVRAVLLAALSRLEARPEEAHTIVDQAVNAVGVIAQSKYKSLANGVLRNFLRRRDILLAEAELDEVARCRHPRWWIARLKRTWPEEWQSVIDAGNIHPPMTLRVNARRTTAAAYLAQLQAADIAAHLLEEKDGEIGTAIKLERPVPVDRLPGFADGLCSVQDAGAQRAARLLDVAPGMRVLDACAAPGGKTAHILECVDVELVALDSDPKRAQRVSENLKRLGLAENTGAPTQTARVKTADCRDVSAWWDLRNFDRILADVPCSASGVVRRHPDIKWLRQESDLAKFAKQQAEILDALWRVLAPGGKLLYVTCSVFPEENSIQVERFAARQKNCIRLNIDGAPELHMLPTNNHDGFYYALLQKKPE